jgi:predicted dehydrogenase
VSHDLRVGVIGFGWMGRLHARSWARLASHYPDLAVAPRLVAVADSAGGDQLASSVRAHGFEELYADWRELLARDDLDVVSVCGPNHLHAEMGVAVADSGRHLWIEKPAGRDAHETAEIAAAVDKAGVQSAAGFNYRNAPAVELARQLILDGRLGRIQTVEVKFLADYAAHPEGALSWRFVNERAGSGVLGDLVSHAVDLGCYLAGEVVEVVADEGRFIETRPLAGGSGSHFARGVEGTSGAVENEDYIGALLRYASGARGTLASSRVAVGEQCGYEISVHGDRGALSWDFRRMGELRMCVDQDYLDASYTTVLANPRHGDFVAFQPGGGIAMGYDDLKVIEAHRLATSIVESRAVGATIHDAVSAARLVDALQTSVSERRWVTP